jgi:hypothetical protein
MHVANEMGKHAGVGEGRCEIAKGTGNRGQRRNCHPFSIRSFQVAAAEGVRLNLNRAFAIRIERLIATIGRSIPAIHPGSQFRESTGAPTKWVCRGGSQNRPRYPRLLADLAEESALFLDADRY